jgi:beta-phosphoglucomutase
MTRCLEAIIFDFDGVIADSERLHLLAYQQVLTPLGLQLSDAAYYKQYLGYDDVGVFRTYARNNGLAWDDKAVSDLVAAKGQRFAHMSAQGEMLYPGSAAFIREAADAVPIAIASGALTHEIEELLSRVELLDLFAVIVGADQTSRSKPSPDPYLEALYRLSSNGRTIEPSRTVAIEDSHWGLASAATAGLRCVAVTNTYTAEELGPHAELVVKGLGGLSLETLDALCERL